MVSMMSLETYGSGRVQDRGQVFGWAALIVAVVGTATRGTCAPRIATTGTRARGTATWGSA